MASVQQLEKLHHIQRLFYASDSLEAAVAGERVAQIISRTEQLIKQRAFLRDERRRLRISTEGIEERKAALKTLRRTDWVPTSIIELNTSKSKHIMLNIGGLMFEAPVYILQRDPKSLLAQLCSKDPPVMADKEGFFYFDRDWWLFRYILAFLRDGTLPDDRNVLSQLYREASFWNLHEMHKAIEEEKLHLRTAPVGLVTAAEAKRDKEMWWRKLPSWWQAVEEGQKKKEAEEKAKKKPADWWMDTAYQGKTFLPLSSASDKVTTAKGEKDAINSATLTWSTQRRTDGGEEYEGGYGGGGIFGGHSYSVVHPSGYEESAYLRSSYGNGSYGGANVAYPRGSLGMLYAPRYDTSTTPAPQPSGGSKSYLQGSVGELKPPAFDTNTSSVPRKDL